MKAVILAVETSDPRNQRIPARVPKCFQGPARSARPMRHEFHDPGELPKDLGGASSSGQVSVTSSSRPTSHNSCPDTVCRRGWEFSGPWDCGGVSAGT